MSEQPKHAPQAAPDAPSGAPERAPRQRALDKVKVSADARASLDDMKSNVEKKEEYDTLWRKECGAGDYALTPADLEKIPVIRKEFTHWSIAGVNAQSFEPNKMRDIDWFENKSRAAKLFSRLYTNGQIQTNFPTMRPGNMNIMLAMIDRFARFEERLAGGQITINNFKSNLEKEFGRENIYGPDGVLNMLLAMQRADAAMQGQELSTTLYDLRLAKNKFTASYRFSELRRKKELMPMPPVKPAEKKPDEKRPRAKAQEAFRQKGPEYQRSVMGFFEKGSELPHHKIRVRPINGKLTIGEVDLSDNSFILNENFYVKFDWPSRQILVTYYTAGDGKKFGHEKIVDAFEMGDMNDAKYRENLAENISKTVWQANKLQWD